MAKRNKRSIFSSGIGYETNKQIFINDYLNAPMKQLFWLARQKKKTSNFKYVWTSNGNIYVKKDENSNPKRITTKEELDTID